jgi:pre-mRNA-splicing factor RBM22/SLT11
MDLQFGLPIAVRDKALEMVAPGPNSDINREYFAQNNERAIEDGRAGVEEYEKSDDKARELLRKLAQSKPYFRKGRAVDEDGNPADGGAAAPGSGPGPVRTRDSRAAARGGRGGGFRKAPFPVANSAPPGPKDWLPPADKNIMSLFVTGVEDDLPEFKLRDFFKVHGKIKSLVVSHMSHCAFVNYETREAAEKAAAECKGRAVIAGCPMRVRWGQPKAIGTMNREERAEMIRDGRSAFGSASRKQGQKALEGGESSSQQPAQSAFSGLAVAAPPGAEDVNYASLAGD